MKKKLFLARLKPGFENCFVLTRGDLLEDTISGLALVRADENNDLTFKGTWSIIDIDSGLFVLRDTSKKKLLEKYNQKLNYSLLEAIEKARSTESYRKRVGELQVEIENWRKSGYEVFYEEI